MSVSKKEKISRLEKLVAWGREMEDTNTTDAFKKLVIQWEAELGVLRDGRATHFDNIDVPFDVEEKK